MLTDDDVYIGHGDRIKFIKVLCVFRYIEKENLISFWPISTFKF